MFDCPFDNDLDDFPSSYKVYLMKDLTEEELDGSWEGLTKKSQRVLGNIPTEDVVFDPTREKEIDAAILHVLWKESNTE